MGLNINLHIQIRLFLFCLATMILFPVSLRWVYLPLLSFLVTLFLLLCIADLLFKKSYRRKLSLIVIPALLAYIVSLIALYAVGYM